MIDPVSAKKLLANTFVFFLQLDITFQCVIATDGSTTFAIFLYNETKFTSARVWFNDGIYYMYIFSQWHGLSMSD